MILLVLALLTFPVRPDPVLTPGGVATTSTRAVCTPGYAGKHRDVSTATKRAVYRAYGIVPTGYFSPAGDWKSDFEIDHLVSLQLGGSNDPWNLWAQSYHTEKYNAASKDQLENRLHWLVCNGKMALTAAQDQIRQDWIALYDQLFSVTAPE